MAKINKNKLTKGMLFAIVNFATLFVLAKSTFCQTWGQAFAFIIFVNIIALTEARGRQIVNSNWAIAMTQIVVTILMGLLAWWTYWL